MYKVNRSENRLVRLEERRFSDLNLHERDHLQEWLVQMPEALGEDLLIIQKEFDGFEDSRERLDVLALDKEGRLVVVENKLDDSGRDVVWQALKYVAYCSSLKKAEIVDIYQEYLDRWSKGANAATNLWPDPQRRASAGAPLAGVARRAAAPGEGARGDGSAVRGRLSRRARDGQLRPGARRGGCSGRRGRPGRRPPRRPRHQVRHCGGLRRRPRCGRRRDRVDRGDAPPRHPQRQPPRRHPAGVRPPRPREPAPGTAAGVPMALTAMTRVAIITRRMYRTV